MRLTAILFVTLFATLTAGLVIPLEKRQYASLQVREGFGDDLADFAIFKRGKKEDNIKKEQERKEAKAKKAEEDQRLLKEEEDKKIVQAAEVHAEQQLANSKNLPAAGTTYRVPSHTGDRIITDEHIAAAGKEIYKQQALNDAKRHDLKTGPPLGWYKEFNNHPNKAPQDHSAKGEDAKPLPNVQVAEGQKLVEQKLVPVDESNPARVIWKLNENGTPGEFVGLVAHDHTRAPDHEGKSDHFKVLPEPKEAEKGEEAEKKKKTRSKNKSKKT